MTIVFYISGHGFGHASRSIELINALVDRRPDLRIIARSQVASWLFERTARPGVQLMPVDTDTGVVQIDSLNLDAAETIRHATTFMATFDRRVAAEVDFLRAHGATMVIADLPPLGIAAGRAAGLPAIAFGNFTWDWIYATYDGGADLAQRIGEIYSRTTLALRLPMWGGFETMPAVRDIPFVARHSHRDRDDTRRALAIPLGERVVLVSFGGYGVHGAAKPAAPNYHVLWPGDVDEAAMYDRGFRYEDLVRAVDVVVTQAWLRNHLGMHRERHRAALYVARGLPRIPGAGRGHAQALAVRVHRARGVVVGKLAAAPRSITGPVRAPGEA